MRNVAIGIALLFASLASCAQDGFFPKSAFESDRFMADWFTDELKVLGEPSLWQGSKTSPSESYRFLWLRTFHHPIAIRLDLRNDGVGILTTKVASGTSGFPQKKPYLVENISRPLTREQTQSFLGRINKVSFGTYRRTLKIALETMARSGSSRALREATIECFTSGHQ